MHYSTKARTQSDRGLYDKISNHYSQKLRKCVSINFDDFLTLNSAVSDSVSNFSRVVKTTTQTSELPISFIDAVNKVVEDDGIEGLLFRGLPTKILSNGLQGLLFSVLWKLAQDVIDK